MEDLTEGALAPEVHTGDTVMNKQIYGDVWAFIMENYTESDAQLTELYLVLLGIGAILKKELGIGDVEVTVE